MPPTPERETKTVGGPGRADGNPQFQLVVVEGAAGGTTFVSTGARCSIGSHAGNDLVLDDPTVSRFHCDVVAGARGVEIRDLDSRNGVNVDGVWVTSAYLRDGSLIKLGGTTVRFGFMSSTVPIEISPRDRFGTLIGSSTAMRAAFAMLERAAATTSTVLLEGETGTGKEEAAASIHASSPRAAGPFVVVDCGALPSNLLESELFGHEKGAFTGAVTQRVGAFENADGGTIFLDEIGELPVELQPKLLRVSERREVRRIGSSAYRPVDVRMIAATHRDLRVEVNEERFRADLYFRLAVLRITLPPLRARPGDVPRLITHLLDQMGAPPAARARLFAPEVLHGLAHAAWPGNVRELRNFVERCIVFDQPPRLGDAAPAAVTAPPAVDLAEPYGAARTRVIAEFERTYAAALLRAHDGNLSAAARAGGLDRVTLWRLVTRHGLK